MRHKDRNKRTGAVNRILHPKTESGLAQLSLDVIQTVFKGGKKMKKKRALVVPSS